MNKNTIIIVSIVLIIGAALGGFFGGMQYQKSQRAQIAGRFGGANGQGFAGRFGGGSGNNFTPVRGQVLSMDNNSITVKQADGTTKIVVLSSNTTFVESQKTSESNLKTGNNVMVLGTTNSDGSVTATNVSINPELFRPNRIPTQGQ